MSVRTSIGSRRYIMQRAIQAIIVFFAIITLNFFIFRIMPGDPRASMIADNMPPDTIAALARKFGLDRPLIEQFFLYLINLFQGDLGLSFSHASEPVWETIFDFRFRNTFILMGSSLIVSILIGMVVGVIAASRRGSKVDTGSTVFFLVAYSMPV
ncbi:MAG: ABC transporter permease, partial [Candidatus Thorarchaeota archaeon]